MIPVIDLGPYLAARPGADAAAAAEIGRALTDVGFFVVVNHGISQALIDDTFALGGFDDFRGDPLAFGALVTEGNGDGGGSGTVPEPDTLFLVVLALLGVLVAS